MSAVVARLAEFFTPQEIRIWLFAKHPLLNGARATDLIDVGEAHRVLEVIESLSEGVYV